MPLAHLQVGIVNQTTGGVSKGLQVGVVGVVEGACSRPRRANSGTLETAQHIANHESPRTTKRFAGWQNNLVSITNGRFDGFQSSALYNKSPTRSTKAGAETPATPAPTAALSV